MSWLFLTIIGYFLNALSILSDKLLLKRAVPRPAVYTFYATILGSVVLLALPFVPGVPPLPLMLVALAAGGSFTAALFVFYVLLQLRDASEAAPLVGSLTPVFILFFAWIVLDETLMSSQFVAFLVILLGSIILIHDEHRAKKLPDATTLLIGGASALLFAFSHVLSKFVYLHYGFVGGLVWRSVGTTLAALVLLLPRKNRLAVHDDFRHPKVTSGAIFFLGKISGAAGFIVLNYAFTIGSISIVNALGGIQHIFLLAIVLLLAHRAPKILQEHVLGRSLGRKLVGIICISLGVALLFV